MAAESHAPEAAAAPASASGPVKLPSKALQGRQDVPDQAAAEAPAADVPDQDSSETSSLDSSISPAELPASTEDAADGMPEPHQNGDKVEHDDPSETQEAQNGHKVEPAGEAKQAFSFSLNASAASFVPGSGSTAEEPSPQTNGNGTAHANGHHAVDAKAGKGQRSDNTGAEGAEYWGNGWSGQDGEYSYANYSDGQSYGYAYAYDETNGWYSYYYPDEYYGNYYDGAANERPKARKTRPRKPKEASSGQGDGAAEGEAGTQDSVLEFGTIRATSMPLGFTLPEALEGTPAGNGTDGAASAAAGQQQVGEASTAQRVEAGMAVLRNNLPGLSLGSLRDLLERAQGDVLKALSGLAQQELAVPAPRQQEVPSLDEENFPSLGSTHGQKSPGDSQSPKSKSDTSSKADTSPKAAADGFAAAAAKPPAAEGKENRPRNGKPQAANPADRRQTLEAHHWVETGAAVSSMYRQAREEASKHASVRNMCFQQAQMAYLAGNKAQAKQLSLEGRSANERMHTAHAAAAAAIYHQRNPSGKGGQPRTMDLHGLHVNEAIAQLASHISTARTSSRPAPLSVIVGTGSHTKGAHHPSRLPTAVRDWLTANYVPFKESVPGMLHLQL